MCNIDCLLIVFVDIGFELDKLLRNFGHQSDFGLQVEDNIDDDDNA